MKKKLLLALIALTCAFCLVFSLAGCNPAENQSGTQQETPGGQGGEQGGNSDEHIHNYGELIPEQPATCKKEGLQAYYYCEDCEKYFDSEKHETTLEQLKISIDPNAHNYIFKCGQTEHWQVCADCGEETAHITHSVSEGVCPACGYVEKCTEGLGFTKIKENEEIIGYSVSKGTATDSHIFIPSFYSNLPVISISYQAFYGCKSLEEITIGNSVTSIGERAFYSCTSLTEITIPDSVTSIGEQAFYNCKSLAKITIPASVTSIGAYAFEGCKSLAKITIPDSVTSIGERAFYGCTSLEEITIGNSVTSIGERAFYGCTSLKEITIPDSVTSIGNYAFLGCTSLKEITIPDSVTSIGACAFQECTSLKKITIPDSVTSIGNNAFYGCKSLAKITIPDSVTSIGDFAFYNCKSLAKITIPASVTSIGACAFYGCENLERVSFENTAGWKVSRYSDMSYSEEINVNDPEQNAINLIIHYNYCWKRV